MPDREKVFDAFRNCITEPKCKDCPWETCEKFHQAKTIPLDLCLDILNLLKEQEAVRPPIDAFGHPYCPKCKILVYETWEFCPHCGQEVKWE